MANPDDQRPLLIVIANTATPYRIHVQQRIAREIPEYRLVTIFTHEIGDAPWSLSLPPEIGATQFGTGQAVESQPKPRFALREWKKAGRIMRWIAAQKVAAVLVITYNDVGRFRLIRWLHARRIPVFLSADSNIRGDRARGLRRLAKRLWLGHLLRRCDAVLPCGRLGREFFLRYGADPGKIHYFPVEPDYAQIASVTPAEVDAVRSRFALDPVRRRLVFSGRLAPEKRVDLLIDAFSILAAEQPNWDLVLAGDGPLRAALEARVPAGVRGRVRFLGFIDHPRELAALYKSCDVLVLPSDFEPWGLVINEAAASGLAIIASDIVGAAAELVTPDTNGALFPAGNVTELCNAIRRICRPDVLSRFKQASPAILASWRQRADPVVGLRTMLTRCLGVDSTSHVTMSEASGR